MRSSRIKALRAAAGVATASLALGVFAPSAYSATITWIGPSGSGGAGNWGTNADWSGGAAPTGTSNTTSIQIDDLPADTSVVTYDQAAATTTSGELIIDSGDTLQATATEGTLTIGAITTIPLSNSGTINFSGASGSTWTLGLTGNSDATTAPTNSGLIESTGGGTFNFEQNANTQPNGLLNTGTFATFNDSTLNFEAGVIIGGVATNASGSTISNAGVTNSRNIFAGVAFNNSGNFSVKGGGGASSYEAFAFDSATTFTNSLGATATVEYTTTNSGVTVGGVAMLVGSYNISQNLAGGPPEPGAAGDTSSLINNGTLTIEDNSTVATGSANTTQLDLNTTGTITNNGTIYVTTVLNNGGTTSINLGQNSTIGGTGGSIIFNDSPGNYVGAMNGGVSNSTFTLGSGQTLSGAVLFGDGTATANIGNITNNGVMNANGVNPIGVAINGSGTFTNNGTVHVSNSGGFLETVGQFQNAGKIQVDNGDDFTMNSGGALTFTAGSYVVDIDSDSVLGTVGESGQIDTNGALILGSGVASLSVTDVGSTVLPAGVVFTLIDPSSSSGYFDSLTEGSLLTVGDNTFTVSYEGGQGSNLTLTSTLVPEPASLSLLAIGAIGLLRRRRARPSA